MHWSVPVDSWSGEPTFIIGGGPSLKGMDFKRFCGRGARVIAINNAGIEDDRCQWADVLLFSDARWLEWNADNLQKFRGEFIVTRKMPAIRPTGVDIKVMHYHPREFSDQCDTLGGWCTGSSAINLAYLFGSTRLFLFGFDMRNVGNWHDNHKEPALPDQHREKFIPTLERWAPKLLDRGVQAFNCYERSALRCFPFIDPEQVLSMSVDELASIEREKYLAVWQRPEYRKTSPGMFETERAWLICDLQPGMTLYDFGSGPCRATKWFLDRGVNATAIDFASNAREFDDVPFVEANLWSMPDSLTGADWGFCCDVMEHIPPEKVDVVLQSIASKVEEGCYFRIATRLDVMGPRLLGKRLHLTVEDCEWWRRRIENAFARVDVIQTDPRDSIILGRH
jgi:hypothetical protein